MWNASRDWRDVHYGYGTAGAIDDIMSRLATIGDGMTTYASYKCLGADQIVTEDYEEADVKLDYGANNLAALDRFGRVLDQIWTDYGAEPDVVLDHFSHTYDIMSRLATIGDGTTTYASYKCLGADQIVTEDYEEADVKLDYAANNLAALDRFGRVVDQLWTDYGADPDVALDHFSHTYDRSGNRLTRTNALHSAFSETYTYNDLNELTSSTRSDSFAQTWTLDSLGNWLGFNDNGTSQTRTADAANQLQSISGSAAPAYDAAGNMTSIPKASNPATALTLKYDAWNRLVEVYDATTLVAKFAYDATGRRILKQSAAGFEHYFHSGQQVIETRLLVTDTDPGPADPKYQYIWSPRYVDALVLRDSYSGGALSSRLYYLNDANFNVTTLVNSAGTVVERYAYTPYGEVTIYDPSWSTRTSSAYSNTTLYTGRELDPETGLYYYRARYYSAELGRFVARDPVGYRAGDANLYRYCENHPTDATDATGLFTTFGYVPPGGVAHLRKVEAEAKKRVAIWLKFLDPGPDDNVIREYLQKRMTVPAEDLGAYTKRIQRFTRAAWQTVKRIDETLAAGTYQLRFATEDNGKGDYAVTVQYSHFRKSLLGSTDHICIFPLFFTEKRFSNSVGHLIHELSHYSNNTGEDRSWMRPGPELTDSTRLAQFYESMGRLGTDSSAVEATYWSWVNNVGPIKH